VKKQRIPRVGSSMTADEKKMWRDYVEAQKSKAPKKALDAWARKYDAKLKGKNRVEIRKSYKGVGPTPPRAVAVTKSCDDRCSIKSFNSQQKIGKQDVVLKCTLDSCEYNKNLGSWVCLYICAAAIRAKA
jgi:hypothetical protein